MSSLIILLGVNPKNAMLELGPEYRREAEQGGVGPPSPSQPRKGTGKSGL